jgi:hypothetical protein
MIRSSSKTTPPQNKWPLKTDISPANPTVVKKGHWFILLLISFLPACEKDFNNVGLDIQPPSDKLNVFYNDTATVVAFSRLVDSIRTDEITTHMLGSYFDPVMGPVTAGFYSQFKLSKSSHSFGENPVLDSLMLSLDYAGIYGDSTAEITVKVWEMGDKIYADSNYYSHNTVIINQPALAVHTFVPNLTDSLVVDGDTLSPHLRFSLSAITPHLGEKLLAATDEQMSTNDNFLNFFFGLYITAEVSTAGGSILYISPVSTLTHMTLYYRNDEADSLSFGYNISSTCARFGHYEHDYSLGDADFRAQVIDGDSTLGNQQFYAQTMAGVKALIRFPYLKNYFNEGSIAINEARLFINAVTTDDSPYPPASTITMVRSDGEGGYEVLQDQYEGTEFFGGTYDKDNQGYWFRITRTVQDLMSLDEPDYGFELFISGGSLVAERSVFAGPDPSAPLSPDDRMKLVITYTKLP